MGKIKASTQKKINEVIEGILLLHQVVTVSEVAEALGVSVQYIRKQCKDGKLTCRKSSDGVWLILKSSVTKEKANS